MIARIAVHAHSTWSYDGTCTLTEVATLFRRLGFDGVLMSEHDRTFDQGRWEAYKAACQAASRGILIVPGIEYEDDSHTVHVLVWGDLPFFAGASTVGEILRSVRAHNGVSVLAHPRRGNALEELSDGDLELLDGIETWNRRYDGWSPPQRARDLLNLRPNLIEVVGLDFHRRLDFFPVALRVDYTLPLTREAVFEALRSRSCAPEAFGITAAHFFDGIPRTTLLILDRARKVIARAARIGA